jgi:hypothetical protein
MFRFTAILLFALLGANSAFSQAVNATLVGTITDVSGASVAGAKVQITEANTGLSKTGQPMRAAISRFPICRPASTS